MNVAICNSFSTQSTVFDEVVASYISGKKGHEWNISCVWYRIGISKTSFHAGIHRRIMNEPSKNRTRIFRPRVAAVALHEDRVLLHRVGADDFWSLPGGRIEMGESSADTLRREMAEEMDVETVIGRMIWVVENFFEYQDQPYHEIGLYYLVTLPEAISDHAANEPFYGKEGKLKITFEWYRLNRLAGVDLRPSFLAQALQEIPSTTEHIIHFDV
jgi:ADP-ribose pyrophosphatase YjhB (NUDIX family)